MRKVIAGIVVVLSATLVMGSNTAVASAPGPGYLNVREFGVVSQNGQTAKLFASTDGDIPIRADEFIRSQLVVGMAWADLDTGKVFVVTIHPTIGRDSKQNPDGWHAHTATVTGGATPPNDFCLVSTDSSPTAGIQIHGDVMDVNVRLADLPEAPAAFDAAAGFTLQHDPACPSGLAVLLVENP